MRTVALQVQDKHAQRNTPYLPFALSQYLSETLLWVIMFAVEDTLHNHLMKAIT